MFIHTKCVHVYRSFPTYHNFWFSSKNSWLQHCKIIKIYLKPTTTKNSSEKNIFYVCFNPNSFFVIIVLLPSMTSPDTLKRKLAFSTLSFEIFFFVYTCTYAEKRGQRDATYSINMNPCHILFSFLFTVCWIDWFSMVKKEEAQKINSINFILKFHHQNNFRWFIHFFTLFISFKILLLFIICVQYFFLCYYCYHSTFCTKNQNNVIYWKKFEEQSLLTLPIYIRGIVCDLETLERVFALED